MPIKSLISLLAFCLFVPFAFSGLSAVPPNDHFTNSIPLSGSPAPFEGSTRFATAEQGEPSTLPGGAAKHSVWWHWVPPRTGVGIVTLSTSNSAPIVKVFRGSALTNLTLIVVSGGASITWAATNHETYYIAVDSPSLQGEFTAAVTLVDRPSNDDFANRLLLPPMTNIATAPDIQLFTSATIFDEFASKEPGEPSSGPNPPSRMQATLWWSWIPPVKGSATIRVSATQTNPSILASVHRGQELTTLVPLNLGYSGLVAWERIFMLTVNAGDRLEIVSGREVVTSPGNITVSVTEVPSPSNDDFDSRLRLEGNAVRFLSRLEGATVEAGEPVHGSTGPQYQSMWWEWTCPTSGPTAIAVTPSGISPSGSISPHFAVYTGGSLNSLVLVTNAGGWIQTNAAFAATAGTTYLIAVATDTPLFVPFSFSLIRSAVAGLAWLTPTQGATFALGSTVPLQVAAPNPEGTIRQVEFLQNGTRLGIDTTEPYGIELPDLQYGMHVLTAIATDAQGLANDTSVTIKVPQSNDNFTDRILLDQYPVTVRGTNAGATYESMEPVHHQFGSGGSVWWSWIAPTSGVVQIAVHSDQSAVLGVYTGESLSALTKIASADGIGRNAFTTFSAIAGTAYQIAVDSPSPSGSAFTLSLLTVPPNDNFAARTVVTSDTFVMRGYNYGATAESGEPSHASALTPNSSVWWSWTSPFTGPVLVSVSNNFTSAVAVYTGNSLSNLLLVKGHTTTRFGSYFTFPAQSNETYAVAVDGISRFGDVEMFGRPDGIPAIVEIVRSGEELILTILGLPGRLHRVDSSVDLVNWEAGATTMLSTDSAVVRLPINSAVGSSFYRIVLPP